MIASLFKKSTYQRPIDTARVPEGRRVYAIGDIHGRNDLLLKLLEKIDADDQKRGGADTELILLGDLVDRGPDSAAVIETALELSQRSNKVRFLKGNHEEIFLRACRKNDPQITRYFLRIGGEATILSYPITRAEYLRLSVEDLGARLATLVPQEHLDFLGKFEDQIVIGDYAFVHAGVNPAAPLAEQKKTDLRWIREEFLGYQGNLEKVIVYGHTIYDDVEEAGCRIGIDTGAWETGHLTAIGLEGGERWYLQT